MADEITKEESDNLVTKIFDILGGPVLDDCQVRNAMIPMIQAFCFLLSEWPALYQEKIVKRMMVHARYLAELKTNENARPPSATERLLSPRSAYIRIVAAGWIPTTAGWARCRDEQPGDLEFALGELPPSPHWGDKP